MVSAKKSLRPFVLLEVSHFTGFFSGAMTFLLLPWMALSVTGSATSAGVLITVANIPGLLMSPFIGSLIDKFGRRRFAAFTEAITGVFAIAVPIVAMFTDINFSVLLILGIFRSLFGFGGPSARKSLVPDVAERGELSLEKANSIHESIGAAGFAAGPAVAALCLNFMSGAQVFWVVGALELVAAFTAWVIRVQERHEEIDADAGHSFAHYVTQGFRTLFKTPSVLIAFMAFVTLAVIYIPVELVVLPRYFTGMHDPNGLGWLITVMAAATSISSFFFDRLAKWFKFSTLLRIGLLGVAIPVLGMSLLPAYWVLIALGLVLGAAWGPLSPLLNTVIQRKVPANERGRVFSLESTIWSGGPMVSMVAVGLALDNFPLQSVYLALALLTLLAAILVAFNKRAPELNTAEFSD
ncbi:MAG: MFS transporter [Micrococcales bacterium]